MVAKKLKSTYSGEGYDIIVDDGSHQNLHTNAAFDELWPLTKGDGYYFMEDIGEPAFSYLDCEPISHTAEKQNITTLCRRWFLTLLAINQIRFHRKNQTC